MISLDLVLINIIAETWVNKLKLEIVLHPNPYPLCWMNHGTQMQVTRQCKLVFAITKNFIDDVMVDVVPLDICGMIFGNPYLWDKDGIYFIKLNQYRLVKDGVHYDINADKSRKKLELVIAR